jgi:hypothetical protein
VARKGRRRRPFCKPGRGFHSDDERASAVGIGCGGKRSLPCVALILFPLHFSRVTQVYRIGTARLPSILYAELLGVLALATQVQESSTNQTIIIERACRFVQ